MATSRPAARQPSKLVPPLVAQISWAHHLVIVEQGKRLGVREFHLRLALGRNASPALIAQYRTHLPDKALLPAKLHGFCLAGRPS